MNLYPAAPGFIQQMAAFGQNQRGVHGASARRASGSEAADLFEQGILIADESFNHLQ
jgi:hypothetical protein